MVGKGHWVNIPYSVAWALPSLRLIPPGFNEVRNWRPWCLGDYIYSKINCSTLTIAELPYIQYGRSLDHFLRKIVVADPSLGLVYMLKADVFDIFYPISLRPADVPKLGLIFPVEYGNKPLVATPLTLTMGWKNLPPLL